MFVARVFSFVTSKGKGVLTFKFTGSQVLRRNLCSYVSCSPQKPPSHICLPWEEERIWFPTVWELLIRKQACWQSRDTEILSCYPHFWCAVAFNMKVSACSAHLPMGRKRNCWIRREWHLSNAIYRTIALWKQLCFVFAVRPCDVVLVGFLALEIVIATLWEQLWPFLVVLEHSV